MAMINSELSENMINKLAGDIAREWMNGKNGGEHKYFIAEYLDVFYASREIIQKKEYERQNPNLDDALKSFGQGLENADNEMLYGDMNSQKTSFIR